MGLSAIDSNVRFETEISELVDCGQYEVRIFRCEAIGRVLSQGYVVDTLKEAHGVAKGKVFHCLEGGC